MEIDEEYADNAAPRDRMWGLVILLTLTAIGIAAGWGLYQLTALILEGNRS